ncbi:MAG: phosphatase [Gammaproteobacteria bacterium]
MMAIKKTVFTSALAAPLTLVSLSALAAGITPIPNANPKTAGIVTANNLSPELAEIALASGATPLENPAGLLKFYGYAGDGPMVPAPGDVQSTSHNVEATKTEPDKNTYLILDRQQGGDPSYDYGRHFLFQGHEASVKDPNTGLRLGHITRINLDADAAHRVTLLADKDSSGAPLPTFDGSTWDPWAGRLLFTAELGNGGGVWQSTLDGQAEDISGALGRGGYEGIQNDSDGNLWIIEDVGGNRGAVNKNARQPNSFVYRFIPTDARDLTRGGKLQALAVMSKRHAGAIVFNSANIDDDVKSDDIKDLHTYGQVFNTQWVTIHDTAIDGDAPFDANAKAKGKATPFKRPENGQFRPNSGFREFYFTETGDTNLNTEAGAEFGGFGGILKLSQPFPSANSGRLTIFYRGDAQHTGLDNIAFLTESLVIAVEDAGDTLHGQRNALDSGYLLEAGRDYSNPANQPLRWLAQGRDASATLDSGLLGIAGSGFQNDGDNEITGIHVSDGDPRTRGILGAKRPTPFADGWRVFYTHQHGDNVTYEVVLRNRLREGDRAVEDERDFEE